MALYVALLLWLNVYIARDLFFAEHTGHMNSMHGFWIGLARLAGHQLVDSGMVALLGCRNAVRIHLRSAGSRDDRPRLETREVCP